MNYEEIKKIVETYGEDYLIDGDIKRIFNIIKDSPSMQTQMEQKISQDWLELLNKRGKIYVYEESRKPSIFDPQNKQYPFVDFSIQDEFQKGEDGENLRTPVFRYVCQAYQIRPTQAQIAVAKIGRVPEKTIYERSGRDEK